MKTKVIIENGETKIILTPENEFDTHVVEKVYSKKESFKLLTEVDATYNYGAYTKHKIEITISEIRPNFRITVERK